MTWQPAIVNKEASKKEVESCQCLYCSGRPNYEAGDSRGVKRSPGASPPSKKVLLVGSPNKVLFVFNSISQMMTKYKFCYWIVNELLSIQFTHPILIAYQIVLNFENLLDSKGFVGCCCCCCTVSFANCEPVALRHRCLRVHLGGLHLEAKHGDPILGRLWGTWLFNHLFLMTDLVCKQGFKFSELSQSQCQSRLSL